MSMYPISFLSGNPSLDQMEIEEERRDDARQQLRPSDTLIDSVADEMAAAFGWNVPPTGEQTDADHAARQCDEAELLAAYPGLHDKPDAFLIDLIANPPGMSDDDEVTAVAAILLERRMTAGAALVPLLIASIAYDKARRVRVR